MTRDEAIERGMIIERVNCGHEGGPTYEFAREFLLGWLPKNIKDAVVVTNDPMLIEIAYFEE